uniref:Ig-like domain-containing protein n=1 Tax=Neogobius melanostomus TaxID=47308 RepID=A0A8C6ULE3_9GOBI
MAHVVIMLIFLASFGISATAKANCDLHAAIGIRLTLPFVFEKLANTERLVWLHNHTIIYEGIKGKVSVGKPDDITSSGSLVLKNPKFTSAGVYQAQAYNATGALTKTWNSFVCVMEKVPKPTLSYNCDQKSVNFNCYTVKSQDLRYSWAMDEKVLTGETRSTLTIPLNKLKSKNSFTCGVVNQVSNEKSDAVSPTCASQEPSPQNLLCFHQKTVMAVLAGAVGTVIILVIVIIVLCCCQRRNKVPKRRERVEPRMLPLTSQEPETDYETMHHVPEMSPKPKAKAAESIFITTQIAFLTTARIFPAA